MHCNNFIHTLYVRVACLIKCIFLDAVKDLGHFLLPKCCNINKSCVYAIHFCNLTNSTMLLHDVMWYVMNSDPPLKLIMPLCHFPFSVFAACSRWPAMAEQDGAAKKNPAVVSLQSHFLVGSILEENAEDEVHGRVDGSLEDKEIRSLSPSSCSSDSTNEMGFDHIDGTMHNLRWASICVCSFS